MDLAFCTEKQNSPNQAAVAWRFSMILMSVKPAVSIVLWALPIPDDCKDMKPPGESYHCPLPWIMDWWILCHVLAGTNGGWRALRFFMAGHPWHILEWMCFSDEVLYRMPAPEGSQDLKIFFTPPMCSFRLTLTKKWINDHKGSWSLLLGMTMWSSPLFFPQEGLYSELFLGDLFRG